jgi:hypothetical protein
MTTISPGDHALTREDLAALRKCDTVSFHTFQGKAYVNACKRVKDPGPFDPREREWRVECGAAVTCYADEDRPSTERLKAARCFAMHHACSCNQEWRTLVDHLLRVGDVPTLDWVAGNDNGYLRGTRDGGQRLHHDQLFLLVKRKGRTLRVWLADSICADNTARMVKL